MGVHLKMEDGLPDRLHYKALNNLVPHLRRLSQIRMHLMEQEFRTKSLEATIDLMATGVILLNRSGRVVVLNQAAKTLLDDSNVLDIQKGFLCPAHSFDRLTLDKCIANALERDKTVEAPGGALRIDDFDSGRSLSLIISPLPRGRQRREDLGAVVYISDGQATVSEPAQQRLESLWGLTPAEARVSAALACGTDLKDYASQWKISIHTARNQLKQALAKSGSRRQSELTRLVLLGPACIRDPAG
jgi:DNA-binding CsgD family transcriptional regulator